MWHVASKLGDFKTAELLFFIVQEARELMIKVAFLISSEKPHMCHR